VAYYLGLSLGQSSEPTSLSVIHFRLQPDGTYHVNSHFNLMNVKGVGLTTGEEYVIPASGAAVENFVEPGQVVTGTVDINLVIKKGSVPLGDN
jgi:hypothetical protein